MLLNVTRDYYCNKTSSQEFFDAARTHPYMYLGQRACHGTFNI